MSIPKVADGGVIRVLLIATAGAVIAVAVWAGIAGLVRPGIESAVPAEFRAHCLDCGHEWTITRDQVLRRPRSADGPLAGSPAGWDCPECSAKASAHLMLRCPNCGHFYLSQYVRNLRAPATRPAPDACPKCGTGLLDWHRTRRARLDRPGGRGGLVNGGIAELRPRLPGA